MGEPGIFERASEFIWAHARLLERRIFEHRFRSGRSEAVVDALRAYQNEDGGFGQALEPDLRGPDSAPIHVEFALRALQEVDAPERELATEACRYLATVSDGKGAVPPALAGARSYPHAEHWGGSWAVEPSLNPTVGIAGLLHWVGIKDPWLDRATAYCWDCLSAPAVTDAHTLLGALAFLEHVPDRERAESLFRKVADLIFHADYFTLEAPVESYTMTPLHFAPTPDARARSLFSDEVIEAHLDDLRGRQQDDGGWPIFWNAPGETARSEWRARWTLDAVSTLSAYGRL